MNEEERKIMTVVISVRSGLRDMTRDCIKNNISRSYNRGMVHFGYGLMTSLCGYYVRKFR